MENGVISGPICSVQCNPDGIGCANFYGMKKNKDKIVQICPTTGQQNTFRDLLQRCIRTAIHMKKRNLKEGDIVGLCSYNHINSCVPFIAATFLGCIPVAFDHTLTVDYLKQLLLQIKPKIMFIMEECVDVMQEALSSLNYQLEYVVYSENTKHTPFTDFLQEVSDEERTFEPIKCKNIHDTCVIVFSSGTTGFPKCICLSHYCILRQSSKHSMELTRGLNYSSLHLLSGIVMLINQNIFGMSIIVNNLDINKQWSFIEDYKVEVLTTTTHLIIQSLETKHKNADISSLKVITLSGCPVTKEQLDTMRKILSGVKIVNVYGMTETGAIALARDELNLLEICEKRGVTLGTVLPNVQIRIVNPDTEDVLGPNEPGELRVKSDCLLNGYYNGDASVCYDKDNWFKTGDIMYYDDDGFLYFVERYKDLMKFRGRQIVPSMLEAVLESHPAVLQAVVVSKWNDVDGDLPTGIVMLRYDFNDVTADEILKYYNEKVICYHQLSGGLKIIKEFPLSSSNKLLKRKLKEMIANNLL